jgi:prophage regulatory protein
MSQRILRRKEVCHQTGLSYSTVDRLEKAGKFPRRLRLSTQAVGWELGQVEEWIASRERVVAGHDSGDATTGSNAG